MGDPVRRRGLGQRLRGQTCEQWQIEVTGGGRIWYLVDSDRNTCWVTYAGTAHPRATDR
ncbi:hypothetical protein [Streptomyces abikoensis]|uniref:Uncharacterized protein n=1 Tax=Streptomyces abikoensis TaxID=97398 RepID=A0ABW7T4E0_9ACTN